MPKLLVNAFLIFTRLLPLTFLHYLLYHASCNFSLPLFWSLLGHCAPLYTRSCFVMSLKRPANHFGAASPRPTKISRTGTRLDQGKTHEPKKIYTKHPDSGVGESFHSVLYPLVLIPYGSWHVLHYGNGGTKNYQYICSKCKKKRAKITAHERKLFLVAERLSWHSFRGVVPVKIELKMRNNCGRSISNWESQIQLLKRYRLLCLGER